MEKEEISRKNLDSQEFLQHRQVTEKIAGVLDKRLKAHLTVLRPLFIPRKLFGTYVKSAVSRLVYRRSFSRHCPRFRAN